MTEKPILGLTMGDPAGIGSEVIIKTLAEQQYYDMARPIVIGDVDRMRDGLKFTDKSLEINGVSDVSEAKFSYGTIDVLHLGIKGVPDLPY